MFSCSHDINKATGATV